MSDSARTTALLERLRRVDPAAAEVDRSRAERAVALHLERLGLPPRPARWAADGPAFYEEILSAGWALHLGSSTEPGPLKIASRALLLARLGPKVQNETRDPDYTSALRALLWTPQECGNGGPPRESTPAEAAGAAAFEAVRNLRAFGGMFDRWAAAAEAARRILLRSGLSESGPDFEHALQALTQLGATLAPAPADLAARYLSDLAAAESSGGAASLEALEPMVDALESGLWHAWPTPSEMLLVARPAMRLVEGRLHDETGPALSWGGGTSFWFLFDQRVDREVVESPATLDPARVERESTPYRRGILIRQLGFDRFLRDAGGSVVAESPAGRLIRFGTFAFVEVRRAPAGWPAEYVRVPATVATPEEGLAWTFGLTAAAYARDPHRPPRHLFADREMGPTARALLDRLRRVDRKHPAVEHAKAEAALALRFGSVARFDWISGRQAASFDGESFCEGHDLGDRDEEAPPYTESLGEVVGAARLACDADAERDAFDALGAFHAQFEVSQKACEAVGVAAARHLGRISLSDDAFDRYWLSWVRMYEAGAGWLWTEPGAIHVLERPSMRVVDGVLDDDAEPAVRWPGGPELRFRRGAHVV